MSPGVTTRADLPDAQWFLARLREAPRSGLVLLHHVGSHGRATDCLRALEDQGLIRSLGRAVDARSAYAGDLVGQQYEAVPFRACPTCGALVGASSDGSLRRHDCTPVEATP